MQQNAYIIGDETVKKYLTVEDVIRCVEDTWRWYGEGKVVMPNKITTDMEQLGVHGWFNSMPAYIGPMDVAGIKVVGGYDANRALGLPYIKANVLITDSRTGILKALLQGDYINDMRTGAQPAVMAKLLVAKTDVVTIIGRDGDAELSVDEIAKKVGTISYEVLCGIADRVPRLLTE